MSLRTYLVVAAVFVGMLLTVVPASAARLRYHFTADPGGNGCLKAPAAGERRNLTGWSPYNCPPPRATRLVSFRHPDTGQTVTVPLALPDSTPRMEYVRDHVVYNYGSYTVEVRFVKDGSADVIYDSGLFRAP
jgi:hypothetical protein